MIPLVEVTITACDNSTTTECAYLSVVSSTLSESGDYVTDELSAYISGEIASAKQITFDGLTYTIHSTKVLKQTCSTKVNAFRTYLSSCDECNGFIHTATQPTSCTDDSTNIGTGTAATFSVRHINTATKVLAAGLVGHVQTYELVFSGRPELNSDNVVVCGSARYKIKEVFNKDDIRKPLRATAELTPLPRADV